MTDTDKLKRLAEAATHGPWNYDGEGISDDGATYREVTSSAEVVLGEYGYVSAENAKYIAAANPHAILALIAENERTESQRDKAINQVSLWIEEHDRIKSQRNEAVALLRQWASEPWVADGLCSARGRTNDFLARIDGGEG